MRRPFLFLVAVALASQVGPWRALFPRLPPQHTERRSPSSDVLLGALPLPDAATRLDAIAATLPDAPGVVVAHGPVGAMASAYFVITMRLWPRPVSLMTCDPSPALEQFRVPHPRPRWAWRIDMRPGSPSPLQVSRGDTQIVERLCQP